MAVIRGMMAASLDGHAADAGGGVGWLEPFAGIDWGFDAFVAGVGTVVMGRRTYQDACTLAEDWPYPGKRAIVVSKTLSQPPKGNAEVWRGTLPGLAAHLRGLSDGDVWVVGGPMLQQAFIAGGALDRLQLAVLPVLLGRGVPVFPASDPPPRQPRLGAARAIGGGMVWLDYSFDG